MPDFERVLDQLEVDLAASEVEKARVQGYVAGKRAARLEVLIVFVVVALIWAFATVVSGAAL